MSIETLGTAPSLRASSSASDHLPSSSPTDRSSQCAAPVPIPWRNFTPNLIFAITHSMTYAVIFPFISDMIASFGVPLEHIGLCSGLAEGIMMLTEVILAPGWARLADEYGRRPVMIAGFSVMMMACPLLGFSTSVWQVILWRACLGLNPASIMVNIVATETSHLSNRSKMFALLAPCWALGMALGAFVGGTFAHPYGRLPLLLGGTTKLWLHHPYALPCIVTGIFDAVSVIIGWLLLAETRRSVPFQADTLSTLARFSAAFKVPGFLRINITFLLYQLATFSWDGLYTIYTYSQPAQGGLGLPVHIIGLLYSAGYVVTFGADPILLQRMEERWGLNKALETILSMWPIIALSIPITQWAAVHARGAMWAVLAFQLTGRAVGSVSWALCDIITMSSFDDYPELMAIGSAISLISGAGGRALGPVIAGWLFSTSTQYPSGSLLRQMPWTYIFAVAVTAVVVSRMTRRRKNVPTGDERQALLEAGDEREQPRCEA